MHRLDPHIHGHMQTLNLGVTEMYHTLEIVSTIAINEKTKRTEKIDGWAYKARLLGPLLQPFRRDKEREHSLQAHGGGIRHSGTRAHWTWTCAAKWNSNVSEKDAMVLVSLSKSISDWIRLSVTRTFWGPNFWTLSLSLSLSLSLPLSLSLSLSLINAESSTFRRKGHLHSEVVCRPKAKRNKSVTASGSSAKFPARGR